MGDLCSKEEKSIDIELDFCEAISMECSQHKKNRVRTIRPQNMSNITDQLTKYE